MSNVLDEGTEIVRGAEESLRELIQRAVCCGEYDRVAVLAGWAEQIAQIGQNGLPRPNSMGLNEKFERNSRKGQPARRKTTRITKARKSRYPIFKRSGDSLVKVGWSKATKSEYQHQAAKAVVIALFERLLSFVDDDKLITMEEILPLQLDDENDVPAYQSYTSLAWLRSIGIIEQNGRRGYSILRNADSRKVVEDAWSELPVHR